MKKNILLCGLSLLGLTCYAQVDFERGYFITDSGERVESLIKNLDWKDNPVSFEYKLTETSEPTEAGIEDVREFGIDDEFKYVRATVEIDRSSDRINRMTTNRNPVYEEEQLFLQVLLDGKASLYSYEDGNLERYFYQTEQPAPEPLIFKKYKTPENRIAENSGFRQQLLNELSCEDMAQADFAHLKYDRRQLMDLFAKYNECQNAAYQIVRTKEDRNGFNLSVRPGVKYSSLEISNSNQNVSRDVDFGSQIGARIGVEAEMVLPYYRNKWSIIIEPTYQYFKSEKEINYIHIRTTNVEVNYSSIELPFGVRYYSFLNENSRLFFNLLYSFDFPLSNTLIAERRDVIDLEINSRNNVMLGMGYQYNNRYNVELRYGSSRQLLDEYSYDADYQTVSLIFGYTIF